MKFRPVLSFSEEDKIGTIQPHDDALLITLRIGDYDMKRVMVDGGSAADAHWDDKLPVEAHQRGIVGHQIFWF